MTAPELTARPLGSDDYDRAARHATAVHPQRPMSAREVGRMVEIFEGLGPCRLLALDVGDRPAGWAAARTDREPADSPLRLHVILPEAPPERLDAAWAMIEDVGRGVAGARLGRADIWETDAATLDVLDRRGWERKRLERFFELELGPARERLLALRAEARARAEREGVRLTTANELGGAAVLPALYRINVASGKDVPRSTPPMTIPEDVWTAFMQPPDVLPDRLWVAVVDGQPVGYSFLDFGGAVVETGYTGVLREHRGRGIARALKLETLGQAADLGVEAVQTDNDSENGPIVHLNQMLGYRDIPGMVQLHKPITAP